MRKIWKIYFSSAYNTSASLAASYGSAVLDPLLQASSLASAASAQTTSGEIKHPAIFEVSVSLNATFLLAACFWKEMGRFNVGVEEALKSSLLAINFCL